jgi:gas vesicle protein GvpL/GvpF
MEVHGNARDRTEEQPHSETRGWYLYGITRGGMSATDLNRQQALSELLVTAPLELVQEGALAAIVQSVPLSEFEAEALEARGDDAAWLEALVSGHNEVITRVHERQAVLPARFGSLYPDTAAVRGALADARDELAAQLDRLEGHDEWAVHVYADPELSERVAADARIQSLEEEIATARPGRAYFLKRKLEEERAAASRQAVMHLAQTAYEQLAQFADTGQVSPPVRTATRAGGLTEILRAAFLVARAELDAFRAELLTLESRHGVQTELTGPWPPYSFVTLPENGQ